jgi:hypothetical protein
MPLATACLAALILAAVPYAIAPYAFVAAPGALGLVFAAISVVTLRRGPGTAAACVFTADYALALWLTGPTGRLAGGVGFGLALLLLLHALELARSARGAAVDAGVVRSQLSGWAIFGVATLGIAGLVGGVARGLAGTVPLAAAPLVAALGALGVVLAVAAALTRATRSTP